MENKLVTFEKNPFTKTMLRAGKGKRKTLTQEQLTQIENLFSSDYQLPPILEPQWFTLALINTFRYTGIRRSQLTNLRLSNIDLINKIIIIPSKINKNHNYHEIPISNKLLPYLEKLVYEMKKRGRRDKDQAFNMNVVCHKVRNKKRETSKEQISHIFRVLSQCLKFPVTPHRFRHTIATQLMLNPDNVYNVKQLLGHCDIKVTLSYIEYSPELIRRCVDSL